MCRKGVIVFHAIDEGVNLCSEGHSHQGEGGDNWRDLLAQDLQ